MASPPTTVHRSPRPDVEIPDIPISTLVLGRARERGDRPALIDGSTGRTIGYGQLAEGVGRVAAGFAGAGLGPGDVVALCSANVPEYVLAFHGVASAGGVTTTLNPLFTAEELARQLQDSGARFLIVGPGQVEKGLEAAEGSAVEATFVLEGPSGGAGAGAAGSTTADGSGPVRSFQALLEAGGPAPEVSIDPRTDVAALPYSSGTTGWPKGVMLTHRNLVANVVQMRQADFVGAGEATVAQLPFFHIYGMQVLMNGVLAGGGTVVTMARFDFEEYLALLGRHGSRRAYVVPPILLALAKEPVVDRYGLAVEVVHSGAAPLGQEMGRACAERLGCEVRQGYGLTETSPATHVFPPGLGMERCESVGPSVSRTDVRIVDIGSGEDLGAGEDGEVRVRGPQVMKGYLGHAEVTAECLDADGWLRTWDIGHVDDDGFLYVVDRLKELIKYKGYQVAPAELEDVLLSHPAVSDAAV
ncbi:MAG TPA: AMP-binding protein, partial [Longimicrobiales bacterium]|nr:AMP-binding protein [Longimicrobiales bacterium]